MAVAREFLGWDRPLLPAAVDWLFTHEATSGTPDLSNLTLVVSGGRARRRLLELLVARAGAMETPDQGKSLPGCFGAGLIPPRIVTPRELPELLYAVPPHNDLHSHLACVRALQGITPEHLSRVYPHPPEPGDLAGWSALARGLLDLAVELAAACLDFAEVAERCRTADLPFSDCSRWEVLAEVHRQYVALLHAEGLEDLQEYRQRKLRDGIESAGLRVVLIGTPDLNALTVRMLRASGAEVLALIHAPAAEANGFDDLGGLRVDYWSQQRLPFPDAALRVVDRPRDQAGAVIDALADLGAEFGPDEITVGLGDEKLGSTVQRALAMAGVRARQSVGRPLTRTRPALLLQALTEYTSSLRSDRLAVLLRHPDLSVWLQRELGPRVAATEAWLTVLDRYMHERLPLTIGGEWPEDVPGRAVLEACVQSVRSLAALLPAGSRPLSAWARPIARLLGVVYGVREWDRQVPEDAHVADALSQIGALLDHLDGLGSEHGLSVSATAAEAVRFTLAWLSNAATPADADPEAVELLGWLDLAADDAPALVITGLNEGCIPESLNADPFLPDRLRRELGLLDNRRRYARDALALRTMVECRRRLTLISGRRGAEGDPLLPSRLLFACDDQALVRRVLQFYGEDEPAAAPRPLLAAGSRSSFVLPYPAAQADTVERLRVTAFAEYLACPYRYYLKHVRKLRSVEDGGVELDPLHFGTLIHSVLQRFGRDDCRTSHRAEAVYDFLRAALQEEAVLRFGRSRMPAVDLQLMLLERRLEAFAAWQAAHAAEGWEIVEIERDVEAVIPPLDERFVVFGRIDRVDRHLDRGWLLLDYKSGDTARTPDQRHRVKQDGVLVWTDLQLPLYRHLARHDLGAVEGTIATGYVCLPKEKPKGGYLQLAAWSAAELEEADTAARWVIRGLRTGVFWPPREPGRYPDGLEGLCFDRCLDRASLITASAVPTAGATGV